MNSSLQFLPCTKYLSEAFQRPWQFTPRLSNTMLQFQAEGTEFEQHVIRRTVEVGEQQIPRAMDHSGAYCAVFVEFTEPFQDVLEAILHHAMLMKLDRPQPSQPEHEMQSSLPMNC